MQINMKARNVPGFLIMLFLWVLPLQARAESSFLKLGSLQPPDHPTSQALLYFQQELGNIFHDRTDIQFFPDAQLGSTQEILEAVRFGNIEIGVLSADALVPLSPLLAAISMPYIFRDEGHRFRLLDGPVGCQLLESLKQNNLICLGFFEADVKNIIATQQHITTPEDFQEKILGKNCISTEKDYQHLIWRISTEAFTVLGTTVETIDSEDVYDALQAGNLDAWEGDELASDRLKIIETGASYFTQSQHTIIPDVLVVSKIWFDTLSPKEQNDIRKAARLTIQRQRKLWKDAVQEATTRLEEAGMIFKFIDREIFYTAVQPVYTQMFEELGSEFENMVQAIRAVK